jgi:hypothetical protein
VLQTTGSLQFEVENRGAFDRKVEIRISSQLPDGQPAERTIGIWELPAGSVHVGEIAVGDLPLQTVGASTEVFVFARDASGDAELQLDAFSEAISADFAPDYASADVYDETARTEQLDGGKRPTPGFEYSGRVVTADGTRNLADELVPSFDDAFVPLVPAIVRRVSPEAALPKRASFPGPVPQGGACTLRNVRFCAQWSAQYVDAGYGEDYLATTSYQNVAARGAMTYVEGPDYFSWYGALDSQGCTPVLSACPGSFNVYAFSQAEIAGSTFTVLECARPSKDDCGTTLLSQSNWIGVNMPIGGATTATLSPPGVHNGSRVMAVLSQMSIAPDMGITSGQSFQVRTNAPGSATGGLGADIGRNWNSPYENDATWKYIIGHEVGHAVHHAGHGQVDVSSDYSTGDSSLALCKCDHVSGWDGGLHCMESQEKTAAAQEEGSAHFFAARIFNLWSNPSPKMINYKYRCNPSAGTACVTGAYPRLAPPAAMTITGNERWLENKCGGPAGRGNERDWNTFLWRWNNDVPNYSSMNEIHATYRAACGGVNCSASVTWSALDTAAGSYFGPLSSKYNRFTSASIAAGIRH